MRSLKLSGLIRRNPDRPSLKDRAVALRATAARVIRRPLPAAGSNAARVAYQVARAEDARRSAPILGAYPELRRGPAWWTTECLSRAFEAGEIAPAEAARLYPLASERELRLRAIEHRLNLGALHFLAFGTDAGPAKTADVFNTSDPARAAVEAHRGAYTEWSRLASIYNDLPPGGPEFIAAYAKAEEPGERETAAFETLLSTPATTVEGLRLLIDYLPTATRQVTIDNGDSDEQRALDLIRASFLGLENAQRLVSKPRHVVDLPPVSDPIVIAIRKEWAAYVELPNDATDEEFDRATARRTKLFEAAERLPATEGSLLAKALALAWIEYLDLWTRDQSREDYATDGRLALDIHAIVTGMVSAEPNAEADAAPLDVTASADAAPDPVLAAITASRAAEAAMKAFGERPETKRMTRALFQEEDRLNETQARTRDAALATVPTTRAGQIALADYVRFQMGLFGMADGDPPDDDSQIWRDTHRALLAALAAPVDNVGADAALIALSREFGAARLMEEAAQCEAGWREERAQARMPERPECLTFRREDHGFHLRQMHEHPDATAGSPVTLSDIQWMSRGPLMHQVFRPVRPGERAWRDFPGQIPEMVPFVEAQARADEIVAAWAAWQAEIARVNAEEGVYAAEEAAELATDAMEAVGRRIAGTPAHTVEGMRVKLRALNYVEGFRPETESIGSALTWSLLRDARVEEA